MVRTYRPRELLTLWCWCCGREFMATRTDATLCGPTCRKRVQRDFRDGVFEALIYRFRWGPKSGRASPVYHPENLRRINARRGRRWL